MKTIFNKRLMACFLTVIMLFSMMPIVNIFAAEPTGTLSVANLEVTYEKTAGNASTCELNGDKIIATAQSKSGILSANRIAGETKVILKNTGSTTDILSFSYEGNGVASITIDNATCDSGSGSFAKALAQNDTAEIVFASAQGTVSEKQKATLTITDISLSAEKNVNVTFKHINNGTYTVDGTAVSADTVKTKKSTESFSVSATPADNYNFYAWYNETTGKYISYVASDNITLNDDAVVYPVFISNTAALFGVGTSKFINLTEACEFATTSTIKTVVLLNNGTVTGSHTIPKDITLLIPFDDANTVYYDEPECTSSFLNNTAWVQPTAYRTLTLASDANITVNGAVSVSGKHAASNGGKPYCGAPTGPVGWVNMLEGSEITLNNGANLYVWGFIQGAGEITAKSGATVYENFQFTDFRGGTNLTAITNEGLVFPINQYYVQNIEVPTVYEAGAKETLYTSAYASSMLVGGTAPFIGEGGMFVVNDGYIVKDYIEGRDRLQVDVFGGITMSSMTVEVSIKVDSSNYILPITNNITININSGTTTLGQSVALLPGVEMSVAEDANLVVDKNSKETLNDYNSGGYHLVVYDRDEWFYGLNIETGEIVENTQYAFGSPVTGLYPLPYAPGRTYNRTADKDLNDAVLDVNGKIILNGYLYTTHGGGAIKSSQKTGEIVMQSGSGPDLLTFQAKDGESLGIMMNSAALMNGDGSYLMTGPTNLDENIPGTEPGTTYQYCATHDCWYTGECEKCNATYTITWMNGSVSLGSAEVEAGTVPAYPGNTPTKAADAANHYTFEGWSNKDGGEAITLPAVTGEATYYAVFNAEAHADSDKVALEGKHYCDKCSYLMYSCSDASGDRDHECDYGCGRKLSECSGGTATCKVQANCTECGQPYGKFAEHKYNSVVTAPTCSEGGYTTYTCSVCNESYVSDKVDALGHKYNGVVTAPTCTEPGYTTYTCSACNDSYEADPVAATGHSYDNGVIVKEPTCNDSGSKKFTCGTCGDFYTEAVSAKGHENIVDVEEKAPTCTDTGLTAGKKCLDCGEFTEAQTEIPALGHDYKSVVTAPTCTAGGYTTYTCSRCGGSYVADEVDAKGHTYDVTYSWEKVSDSDWKCTATATCACNDVQTESVNATATVTKNATCTEPGNKVLHASFKAEWAVSQEKEEVIPALGHDYNPVVTAPTCTAGGYTTYTCANCSDSYVADEVKSEGHKYDAVVTAPTCTAGGYTTYTCSVCGDIYVGDTVSALGHGNIKGLTYTDLKDGNHSVTCNDCDTVTVASEAHSYDEDTHICKCKAVETFELTIEYIVVNDDKTWNHEEKTIKVPYGANIYNELAKESGFYKKGEKVFVNDPYGYKGEIEIHGWLDFDAWDNLDENSTMPAKNLHIYQEHGNYGWEYFEGSGLAYYDGGSYLEGWNYIEEDYDGVDGGAWYYFEMKESAAGHSIGIRAEGITRALYPTEEIDGVKYEADKETLDYCESKDKNFIDAESGLFLFGEDGKFLNDFTGIKEYKDADRYVENGFMKWHPGVVNVDGEYYYFIGDEAVGGNVPANGDTYIIRNNGSDGFKQNDIYNFKNGKLSGADGIVDGKYYNGSKLMTGNGLTELDDKYIYVRSNGEVVANHKYWIGDNEFGIVPGFYDFDADGYMIDIKTTDKEGIFFEDGAYYYYENGVPAYMGLINYTGTADNGTVYENDWIYVRSNGQLATGEYWTTKNNSEFKTQTYIFDEFGKMVRKDGIIEENGNLYYYVSGIKQKGLGLIELEGKYYYVRTAGELVRNREYWITNVNETGVIAQSYFFDNNGVMQDVVFSKSETVNGVVDGYYYENGKIVYGAGLVELDDGSIIYVRSNGQLATGVYWPTTLNGVLPAGKYDFGTDGRLVTQ